MTNDNTTKTKWHKGLLQEFLTWLQETSGLGWAVDSPLWNDHAWEVLSAAMLSINRKWLKSPNRENLASIRLLPYGVRIERRTYGCMFYFADYGCDESRTLLAALLHDYKEYTQQ